MSATTADRVEVPTRGGALAVRAAAAVVVIAALLSLQVFGIAGMVVGYLASVLILVVTWALVIDPPGRVGIATIGGMVALLVSAVQLWQGPSGAGDDSVEVLLAGAVLALVAAMVLQIARRPPRAGVVASLASATTLGMIVVSGSLFIPLREGEPFGREVTAMVIGVAASALIVGRLVDALTLRPAARAGVARGVPGLVLGLVAGVGVGMLYAAGFEDEHRVLAAGIAVGVAFWAVLIDLVAAFVVMEHRRGAFLAALLSAVTALFVAVPAAQISARLFG